MVSRRLFRVGVTRCAPKPSTRRRAISAQADSVDAESDSNNGYLKGRHPDGGPVSIRVPIDFPAHDFLAVAKNSSFLCDFRRLQASTPNGSRVVIIRVTSRPLVGYFVSPNVWIHFQEEGRSFRHASRRIRSLQPRTRSMVRSVFPPRRRLVSLFARERSYQGRPAVLRRARVRPATPANGNTLRTDAEDLGKVESCKTAAKIISMALRHPELVRPADALIASRKNRAALTARSPVRRSAATFARMFSERIPENSSFRGAPISPALRPRSQPDASWRPDRAMAELGVRRSLSVLLTPRDRPTASRVRLHERGALFLTHFQSCVPSHHHHRPSRSRCEHRKTRARPRSRACITSSISGR